MVVSPELADVLSTIICRVRDTTGRIPAVSAYDERERDWLPPAPLLFQRRVGFEHRAINAVAIRDLLDRALAHTGLADTATGEPLHFTPRDFRRLFITDAILSGLPPHIAQVIAGHEDINVTMGYRLSTRKKPYRPTWRSWPAAEHCDPARSTESPPMMSGPSSSVTSNAAKSRPAPAAERSAAPVSTNTSR